jgi:alkylation response protein AidB-like acyl-CoA dehydrogenase
MTIVDTTTPRDVLDRVQALTPYIAEQAPAIEGARRLPADVLDQLVAAGCFRLLLPQSHHGLGAEGASALRVFEALAAADASVGWTAMIGAGSWFDLTGLPRSTFDEIFCRPNVITAGAFAPEGAIGPDGNGGYRVTGRWGFASGCEHADWIFGNCFAGIVDGMPQLRGAVFSRDEVTIEDTWTVSGLCGTGSHHFRVDDVVVAADRTFDPLTEDPCIDDPIVRIPAPSLFALGITSVALGVAKGALDDIRAMATDKVPLLAPAPLAANPRFEYELATADTDLRGARSLLYETAEQAWAIAEAGAGFSLEDRARLRATGVWATARAADVVTAAYRAGGGSSVYATCPLQRRLRDINAITQHFLVKADAMTSVGAVLAGGEPYVPVF